MASRSAGRSLMSSAGSGASTSSPDAWRCSTSQVPTNPWPPVTNARTPVTLPTGTPAPGCIVIEPGQSGGAGVPGEQRGPSSSPLDLLRSRGVVLVEDGAQGAGEGVGVAHVDQAGGVAHDLGDGARPRRH